MLSTSIYYTQKCSCLTCKKVFTQMGAFFSHKCISTQKRNPNPSKGIETRQQNLFLENIQKWKQYYINPSKCKNCFIELDWFKKHNTFCSSSCSASYNNIRKQPRTQESKHKTKISMLKNFERKTFLYTKIFECVVCNKFHAKKRKTCSEECLKNLLSKTQSKNLSIRDRRNTGRGRKSYLEKSFEDWLNANNVTNFIMENKFYNYTLKKTYYADFTFPEKKLIIELDGTQHEKTKVADHIRDSYLREFYGYKVLRITYKEYKTNKKLQLVKNLLGI